VASDSSVFMAELASNAMAESSSLAKLFCTVNVFADPWVAFDTGFVSCSGILIRLSGKLGEVGSTAAEALFFFLICKAFINRAFSGVMVGVFADIGDIKGFIGVFSLAGGRPPLVCGLTGVVVWKFSDMLSGIGGGGIIGVSVLYVELGLCRDPFPNIFNPIGSVEIGL